MERNYKNKAEVNELEMKRMIQQIKKQKPRAVKGVK
jgi:hypothetical protein